MYHFGQLFLRIVLEELCSRTYTIMYFKTELDQLHKSLNKLNRNYF